MEHFAVQVPTAAPSADTTAPGSSPARASENEFAAAIELAASPSAETIRSAERLIGTQIRPPAGGCGCDALAAATITGTATATTAGATSQGPARLDPGRAVEPGDLLELAEEAGLGRPHLAVARSTLEMIAVGGDGVVRVEPIPFDRLLGLLRQ